MEIRRRERGKAEGGEKFKEMGSEEERESERGKAEGGA
jgi:hypothetical protein